MELCSRFHPEPTVSGFENRTENKRARSMNSKDPLFLPPAAKVAGRESVNDRRGEIRRPVKILN